MSRLMTGAEILVKCLEKQGVKVIFGMPGSITREIYAALYERRNTIRHISVRHEGGASLMAEGYARVTGEVGVCLTIPGPGATNAYTGLLEAYTACTPVLLITAQNASIYAKRQPSKMVHGLDQISAFRPVTKHIERVETVEKIPEAVHTIFGVLRSGRPKPALLEITRDALAEKADLEIPAKNEGVRPMAESRQIKEALELLTDSLRPFILAGRGIYHSNASDELLEFAKLIQAPVATTAMGKGVISEKETLSLGYVGTNVARSAMEESDLIVAIGARFVQVDTDSWSLRISQPLIDIEADGDDISKEYNADIDIVADPKSVLQELINGITRHKLRQGWGVRLDHFRKAVESRKKPKYLSALRRAMAQEAILSVDVHTCGYDALSHFEVYNASSFLHSPISNTLGYALPAAIGAKVAFPNRQVVAFCGDGGFMLNSPELATAMKYNLNVVAIVMNSNSFATIKDVHLRHFGRTLGVDLCNPDFIKFADSFGSFGFRVKDNEEFEPTVKKALTLDKPTVVEVLPRRSTKGRIFYGLKQVGYRLKKRSLT